MSAAVSAMQSQPGAGSTPGSRMGTHSPIDNKHNLSIKNEESNRSTSTNLRELTSKLNASNAGTSNSIVATNVESRPADKKPENDQAQNAAAPNGTPDYFSLPRPSRLDQEPNPFEQSFATNSNPNPGDPSATPKAILPPVTAMTSPAPLLPGGSGSYNWGASSLRSGPLSPAMLQGPTNSSGALGFDSHLRTGLTPNESGIRSGLTPGGSGSMFPAPSPSGIFQPFGGSATPSTMEFQKTALSAARKSHPQLPSIGSQSQEAKPEESHINNSTHQVNGTSDQSKQRQPSDPFNADPAHNAANGLFMLAQLGNGAPGYQQAPPHMGSVSAAGSIESSPNLAKRAAVNNATSAVGVNNRSVSGSSVSNTVRGMSEISNDMSDSSQERDMMNSMTAGTRNAKGKNGKGKGASTSTGKRKNEDTNGGNKASNKKTKNVQRMGPGSDDGFDMDDDDDDKKDTKKMTDEEKRKNFLERNRVAALKCRQRKKQWLANLQAKVEMYGTENDALNATVQALREEIVSLKTLLLAHKDCPVARANGVQLDIASLAAGQDYGQVQMMAPYAGMGMPAGVMHHQATDNRRFS